MEEIKRPSKDIRILGVQVDSKLQWSAHQKRIQKKAATQIGALVQTTASTWGASFLRARQVYTAVVRPALAYGAAIWHNPSKEPNKRAQGIAAQLQPIQNKCLRIVAGAYKATPIQSLEVETYTPPLDLYLDSRLAKFRERLAQSETGKVIQEACSTIRDRLKKRKRGSRNQTQNQDPPKSERDEWREQRNACLGPQLTSEKQRTLEAWRIRWREKENQRAQIHSQWDQIKRPPDPKILQLHKGLKKAESSMLIQLRTGRIGLNYFLNKAKVPGYESGQCSCNRGPETPRHILIYCPKERRRRTTLRDPQGGHINFNNLLDSAKGAQLTSKWMIQSGRLHQFQLAQSLLYEESF